MISLDLAALASRRPSFVGDRHWHLGRFVMEVKASGRAALIVAAGLWIGLSGLAVSGSADGAQAAPASTTAASDKPVAAKPQPAKKPAKQAVEAKPGRVAAAKKPAGDRPIVKAVAKTPPVGAIEADVAAPLPDTVANANAQMPASDPAVADRAVADAQLVAPDQLNDLDLAAQADATPATTVDRSTGIVTALAPHDDSLWGQTSLIGKIFIAFGGLLTAASAARMFIV
jgi:hypothetical protein